MTENKYEVGARQIVDDLRDTRWEPALGPIGDNSPSGYRSPLAVGLMMFAVWVIWRLR